MRVSLLLTAVLLAAAAGFAAPGDLDPSFGIGGRVYPAKPSGREAFALDMAIQPDNKIIVLGYDLDDVYLELGLSLTRYLPDGSLDTTFGTGGKIFERGLTPTHLALQADGNIVVAARTDVLRYLPNGTRDLSFDGDGRLEFGVFQALRPIIQNDGRIIVAGILYIEPNFGDPALFGLARLNADGSFDTSFGSTGFVTTEFPFTSSYLDAIVIQNDGKIVAAGTSSNYNNDGICNPCNIALSRYYPDGSLDLSFGISGRVTTPGGEYNGQYNSLTITGVTLQHNQKIVVSGHYSAPYDVGGLVTRYVPIGGLDASFGVRGQVSIPNLCPYSIAIPSDGNIIIAGGTTGYDPSDSSHEIGRLFADGAPDPSFGSNGRVTTLFPDWLPAGNYTNGRAFEMAVQADGKIVTAGNWSGTDYDGNAFWSYHALARYMGGGSTPQQQITSRADFDGDGRTDVSVYRPSEGNWYYQGSSVGFGAAHFGEFADIPAPGDFDGDGTTDISVFRPSSGFWYRLNSINGTFSAIDFGLQGDIPQAGDYDGDGLADQALFRPSDGTWRWLRSSDNDAAFLQFGSNGDTPVTGDYDGDGRNDPSVFRRGIWYRSNSSNGTIRAEVFGLDTDLPVPADYDGDSQDDIAVFRPSDGNWYFHFSLNGLFGGNHWGQNGDIPAPGDYDGDGQNDHAVYRDSIWYVDASTAGPSAMAFGLSSDLPIPNSYIP